MRRRRCGIAVVLALAVTAGCATGSSAESGESVSTTSNGNGDEVRRASGEDGQSSASSDESAPENDSTDARHDAPPDGFQDASVLEVLSGAERHAILLGDSGGEYVLPIFIGRSQAMAVKLRLERRRFSRPLTHDLLDRMIAKLDGEVVKVHVDSVKSGVFVGTVFLETPSDEIHELDARSSDAIAIAVGNETPIYVAESVFDKAGVSRKKLEDRLEENEKSMEEGEGEEEGGGPYY